MKSKLPSIPAREAPRKIKSEPKTPVPDPPRINIVKPAPQAIKTVSTPKIKKPKNAFSFTGLFPYISVLSGILAPLEMITIPSRME